MYKAEEAIKYVGNKEFLKRSSGVLNDVKTGDWELWLRYDQKADRLFIQIQFDCTNNYSGEPYRSYCRKWYLSPFMTNTEIVRTAYKAYEAAVIHEMQENFTYKDVAIFDPHRNVELLVSLDGFNDERT